MSVQSYGIDPVEFRRVIRVLRDNPRSVLLIAGPSKCGKKTLWAAVISVFPCLQLRVLVSRGDDWDIFNIDAHGGFYPLYMRVTGVADYGLERPAIVALDMRPLRGQSSIDFDDLRDEVRAVVGRVEPAVPRLEPPYRFFAQERVEWDPRTHRAAPEPVKESIKSLLLARNRPTVLADVPLETMFAIFVQVQRNNQ